MSVNRSVDISGQRFGRLVVVEQVESCVTHNGKDSKWKCICDCGNEKITRGRLLRDGTTQSCGCLRLERLRAKNTKPYGIASFNQILADYKSNAKKRNQTFDLTVEQTKDLMSQNCHYCGIEPNQINGKHYSNGSFIYNGIDRMDSNKGYIENNVVPCCGVCNRAKYTMSYNDFIAWINRLRGDK